MLLILAALAQTAAVVASLDLRWLVPFDALPAAPASYDSASAYVPLRGGVLVAVDLDRGTERWRRDLATDISPSSGDGLVFVATEGALEALAGGTGVTRWRTSMPGRLVSVTWDNGWILCATDAGDFTALRASDGELIWRVTLDAALVTAPAAGLDRLYLGLEGARVVALELATGRPSWTRTLTGRISGLTAADGQLIAGTTGNAVFSLDLVTGRQRWRWRVGGDAAGRAASDERHVYFAARDNVIRAVDIRSGNLRWTAELASRPVGGPQVLGDTILVPLSTTVALFAAATGEAIGGLSASGEISAAPYLRGDARPTAASLIAMTRDGRMQGFGPRFEDPPAPLGTLPGQTVVP